MLIWSVEKIEDSFFFQSKFISIRGIHIHKSRLTHSHVHTSATRRFPGLGHTQNKNMAMVYTQLTPHQLPRDLQLHRHLHLVLLLLVGQQKQTAQLVPFWPSSPCFFFWLVGLPWPLPFSFRQPNLNRCKRWWALRFKGNKENMRTWVPNVDHVLAQWLLPPWFSARSPGNKFATELDQELQLQLGAFRVSSEASTTAVRSARVFPSKIMSVSLGNSIRLNIFKEFEFERSWNLPAAHGTSWGLGIFDSCVTIWWRHLVVWNDVT